jgi:hypothetical protein
MSGFFESELFYLLAAGLAMIVIWLIIKRGRMPEEDPSVLEWIMMFAGILAFLTGLLILVFRADVLEDPGGEDETEQQQLEEYDPDGTSGCSKPKDKIKDYRNEPR